MISSALGDPCKSDTISISKYLDMSPCKGEKTITQFGRAVGIRWGPKAVAVLPQ